MESNNRSVFAVRLRMLRQANGLTQEEVAAKLNLHRTSYTKYETACATPDYTCLVQLADLFHVSADYLLGKGDEPSAGETLLQDGAPEALSSAEQELLVGFRRLMPEQQQELLDTLRH